MFIKKRGFTLLETLVYLTLFTIIIGGLVASSYMLFESSDRNQSKAMVQEEANYLMAKMVWALNNAASASVSGGSTLTITRHSAPSVTISASGDTMLLDGVVLNNTNVTIDNLLFIVNGSGSDPESVEIGLLVSAKTPTGATITHLASTTRYIRK